MSVCVIAGVYGRAFCSSLLSLSPCSNWYGVPAFGLCSDLCHPDTCCRCSRVVHCCVARASRPFPQVRLFGARSRVHASPQADAGSHSKIKHRTQRRTYHFVGMVPFPVSPSPFSSAFFCVPHPPDVLVGPHAIERAYCALPNANSNNFASAHARVADARLCVGACARVRARAYARVCTFTGTRTHARKHARSHASMHTHPHGPAACRNARA